MVTSVTTQDDSILWGDLQLRGPLASETTYEIETMAEGSHFGNPVSIVEQIQSMAIDGALAARTGWDARTIAIRLRLSANDGETLAQVEQMLTAQVLLDQPPPIVWTPPLGSAAPAVFDVLVADLQRDTSDGWSYSEKYKGYRYFVLTLTCLPFARAMDTVVVPALAPPPDPGAAPVTTMLDDCTSTTGWTKDVTNTTGSHGPTVSSGAVTVDAELDAGTEHVRLIRHPVTATAMPSGQPYLVIDVAATETIKLTTTSSTMATTIPGTLGIVVDSVIYTPVASQPGGGENGSTRLYFDLTGVASFMSVTVRKDYDDSWVPPVTRGQTALCWAYLKVYRLFSSDTLATASSTSRQQSRLTNIYGAMPTRATIRMYDATPAALGGDILVYTSSNTAWQPPLRTWLHSSAAVSIDATRVSDAYHQLGPTPSVFLIPANLLEPGAYALLARIDSTVTNSLTWQARMVAADGSDTIGSSRTISGQVTVPAPVAAYAVYEIADSLMLPLFEVETDDYAVELTLTGTSDMRLDEAWLFGLDNGALTWLKDPEGDNLEWIEVRSPDLGAARPSVFGGIGDVGALSACVDAKAGSFGGHRFEPGPLLVFTMSVDSLVAQCELEYFPRFHSHPAADQSDPDDGS